jgi:hypothetical protein
MTNDSQLVRSKVEHFGFTEEKAKKFYELWEKVQLIMEEV